MSDYSGKNIFEKIAAFIPGYKGYSEREGRRDTDKILRVAIADYLERIKTTIDSVILYCMDKKELESVKELDRIKKNLGKAANQIRYAPHGESGFFDVVQVKEEDLDRLYQYDLKIKDETQQLDVLVKSLDQAQDLKGISSEFLHLLDALSDRIADREKVITEVRKCQS